MTTEAKPQYSPGLAGVIAGETSICWVDPNAGLMYRGYEQWGRAAVPNVNGTWYHVHIEARRSRYRVFVNGDLQIDFTDEVNSRPRGRVALAAYTGGFGECVVLYDNVEVRALR